MAKDDQEIMSALRKVLADKVGDDRYTLWFGPRTHFVWSANRLTILAPNEFFLQWIRTIFLPVIEEACQAVCSHLPEIHFAVADEATLQNRDDLAAASPSPTDVAKRPKSAAQRTGQRVRPRSRPTHQDQLLLFGAESSKHNLNPHAPQTSDGSLPDVPLPQQMERQLQCQAAPEKANHAGACPIAMENRAKEPCTSAESYSHETGQHNPQQTNPLSYEVDPNFSQPDSHPPNEAQMEVGLCETEDDWTTDVILSEDELLASPVQPTPSTAEAGNFSTEPSLWQAAHPQNEQKQDNHAAGNGPISRDATASPQVRSPGRQYADLSAFVVGDCNRLAFAAADAVVRNLGSYSPLVVHGPSGVGKTHLLEGIWKAVKHRHPRLAALCLSAEQFTSAFVEAIRGGGIPAFRQKYRGLQLFILDDLHFFLGKRQTQIELLYTIDTLLKNACQVVCAADRPPRELRELSPELISRLESGVVCRIDPPDYETRLRIVEQLTQECKVSLSAEVQTWIAERFASSVRQITGSIRRLEAAGRALRRPLDIALAEQILGDLLWSGAAPLRLADIEREVCHAFDLPDGALRSERKDRRVTYPRMLAMWLARKYTTANLSEIGRYFGKRSHATVISAQKKVDEWLKNGQRLQLGTSDRPVTEALQDIRRRLRAG